MTGFTNGEEAEAQFTDVVPFLVEDELMRLGAVFEKVRNWQPFSIVDGRLVTGQNPASSTIAAKNLLKVAAAETMKAAYPPGTVIILPGNTSHFHRAKWGEYITQ